MANENTDPLAAYVKRLFEIESGGNPNAVTGSNRGLGQFGRREEAAYGITDANRTDPMVQAAAVAAEHAKNTAALTRVLGSDPTFADHYLAHQQGLAGASALLANPDQPAWKVLRPFYKSDAIAQLAVTGNIPRGSPLKGLDVNDISAGGFTGYWRDKFNRGLGSGGQPETVAAASFPAAASGADTPAKSAPAAGAFEGAPAATLPAGVGEGLVAQARASGQSQAPATAAAPAVGSPATAGLAGLGGGGAGAGAGGGTLADLGKQLMARAAQPPKSPFPFPVQQFAPANTGPLKPLPLQLPKFGEGGIVDKPTLAMVGEKGPEAIVPLSAFEAAAARTRAPYAHVNDRPSGLLDVGHVLGKKLASVLTAPRDAFMGNLQVSDPATGMPTPEAMSRGMQVANSLFTSGIPMAPRGAVGAGGGRLTQPSRLSSEALMQRAGDAQSALVQSLKGVESGGHPVEPMDLALNSELADALPAAVKAAHVEHQSLRAEVSRRIQGIDTKIQAAGHEPMDLALSPELLASAPLDVQKLMGERNVLIGRPAGGASTARSLGLKA